MGNRLKARLLFGSLTACLIGAMAGTVTGSLAWWIYSTRATVSYEGTSVSNSGHLQIGIVTDVFSEEANLLSEDELEEGTDFYWMRVGTTVTDGHQIAWVPQGYNLSSKIIKKYLELESHGYATESLSAVSSQAYKEEDPLVLKTNYVAGFDVVQENAESSKYYVLPLAFRVLTDTGKMQKNKDIYLTNCTAEVEGGLTSAMRIHFNNEDSNDDLKSFILNPSAKSKGKNAVAGPLNLNMDDYYDIDPKTGKEIVYGDCEEGSIVYNDVIPTEDSDFIPLNGTDTIYQPYVGGVKTDTNTTFYAKHRAGTTTVKSFTPKYANYLSLDDVSPVDDIGLLEGSPVTRTSNVEDNNYVESVALLTLTVWLEGWDHCVIDQNVDSRFNLGLEFQINR